MNDFASALESALAMLAKRDRSERTVRDSLVQLGYSEDIVSAVIARIKAQHILDELRMARSYVLRRSAKGIGSEKIRLELEALKVDEAAMEAALNEAVADKPELAEEALRIRLKKSPPLDRARASRFLFGRGFAEDDVERAVNLLFGASDGFTE